MTTTRFSEPARLSAPSKPLFYQNRWSATWFWSLLSKVFRLRNDEEYGLENATKR